MEWKLRKIGWKVDKIEWKLGKMGWKLGEMELMEKYLKTKIGYVLRLKITTDKSGFYFSLFMK